MSNVNLARSARESVQCYLDALAQQDWPALEATLAAGVVRLGPYGDVVEGAEPYARFLAETVPAPEGYTLVVERLIAAGSSVTVELSETVTTQAGERLRTDEALVFDVDANGAIERVAVYLQKSRAV